MNPIRWPGRPFVYAALGGLSAFAIYTLTDSVSRDDSNYILRFAIALAVTGSSLSFALTARRERWLSSIVFSLLMALVTGGIGYWTVVYGWPYFINTFSLLALAIAVFVITPFFQATLHSQWDDYKALHDHAWSNAVAVPLGLLFVVLTLAVAHLLAGLFSQIEIEVFRQLLRRDITGMLLGGVALGASLGVLREHESVVASTQRLVQSIFALLTPPLALGIGFFLLALAFTGLDPLWAGTRKISIGLVLCALAAMVFINSVVRESAESQSNNVFMQWAARLLAMCIAPLAIITALAVKLRIDQYGWTPDRVWASIICALLVLYGLLYFLAVLRQHRFNAAVRQANLLLAIVISVIALVLATPILDFGAYSTKDQLSRLQADVIAEDQLDLVAMAFDFGPAGRQALNTLNLTANNTFSSRIEKVLGAQSRRSANHDEQRLPGEYRKRITVLNGSTDLPEALLRAMRNNNACEQGKQNYCYLLWTVVDREAFVVSRSCYSTGYCEPVVKLYSGYEGNWVGMSVTDDSMSRRDWVDKSGNVVSPREFIQQLDAAAIEGKVQVKPVQRLQVYIDGQPFGPTVRQR